jgi:anti-sigma regulatory factor (Ser/Thr protein kinase)/CheY-like chemotaxis protein
MKRILVIDSDSAWVSQASVLPYEIETAHGPLDALRRLRQRAFDVMVTSARTHIDEDLALLNESRQVRPGLKAIVLAPSATTPDVIAALRAQVFGCLIAPFTFTEVADMIRAAAEAVDWRDGIKVLAARAEWISLRVTCSLVTAERLTWFMAAMRSDVPDSVRDDLLYAFREVLMNAMEHGAGFDPEKVIDVSAVRTERAIVYYFRDPGAGFDTAAVSHPAIATTAADPLAHLEYRATQGMRPGGFGMLIVRQLVDEVMYSETGNEVILIKHTG